MNNLELGLSPAEAVSLTIKLTESIYGAHVHNGKATIPLAYALDMAASIVGAAQSEKIARWISDAMGDPDAAVAMLGRNRQKFNLEVDQEQSEKIIRLAAAMDRDQNRTDSGNSK
ncbi:hypothetical protein [Lichenifustis flavocetrariae]|uniref:Uncharacterized protein n=1 Tax=Lichenifustis flavocetrariae TaxID=2949735 RepID=A0AA42CRB7_9HYPH|nr:hypothetical protein [Lichenifustis flavocetrariae]MCW6512317.1 hypothetical protein [Lichenifustis flavocetrariae]